MSSWEKSPEETAAGYAAFARFRDMGPTRSLDGAYRQAQELRGLKGGRASGCWLRWAAEHEWKRRAELYDAHLELRARREAEEAHVKNIAAFRAREQVRSAHCHNAAMELLDRAIKRIDALKPEEIEIAQIPGMMRAASALSEYASNAEANALGVAELLQALADGYFDREGV